MILPRHAVLLIVDVQSGFDNEAHWGPRNNPGAEANIARMLGAFREVGRPVIFIQHMSQEPKSPLRASEPGNAIKPEIAPRGERVFQKTVHSAWINTPLERTLRAAAQDTLVVCGLTTDHCVSTTTRMGSDMGFTIYLVDDACACHDRKTHDGRTIPAAQVHEAELAALHNEFATVVKTQTVLDALAAG
ncbi:MAG TPA: cysteine hydrolase family protein [Candidatus Koribacter sp.]|jgi:nicotinamidase-related amidase